MCVFVCVTLREKFISRKWPIQYAIWGLRTVKSVGQADRLDTQVQELMLQSEAEFLLFQETYFCS